LLAQIHNKKMAFKNYEKPPKARKYSGFSVTREKLHCIKDGVFIDPACGSGNFLTETYLSLRHLENECLSVLQRGQIVFGDAVSNHIQVSIGQFYGIEINDFAVTVAKTALWIAEIQMMKETEIIVHMQLDYLPLKTYANIIEENALRLDWESVVRKQRLDYIMGNPPFVGYSNQSAEQKANMLAVYVDEKGKPFKTAGKIDYVAAWYYKAAQFIKDTRIRAAFVSTNSITQGEQVAFVWKPLIDMFSIHIDFAHRTFKWSSEATEKAAVHCIIVGFGALSKTEKALYSGERKRIVKNINPYLVDALDVFVESRKKPICDVPEMITGNRPADGGHLIIEDADLANFIKTDPLSEKYIRRFMGSAEFINNKKRWCLWLVGISPSELRKMPEVMKRVAACKADRENAPDAGRRKLAATPALFRETNNPDTDYIVVPRVSSERRRYIPMGFMPASIIVNDSVQIIPNATIYHFAILTSNVHMAWTRAVCGRLKSDYRYSKDIVYNNFPWPNTTNEQKADIEKLAQTVLDARAKFPDSSLADLYDPLTMPPVLLNAHRELDRAVMKLYGFPVKGFAEADCVAKLMERYQALAEKRL